jgi:uncharacterized membrane protein HdeD (DUF308 family)
MTAKVSANSNNWIWTVLKGVVALVLGIFLIAGGETASASTAYAVAVYIALAGGMQVFSGLLNRRTPGSTTDRIRGLVGLVGGVTVILLLYFNVVTLPTAFTILAILVIVFGLLGLFESFFDRGRAYFRWMPVIINVILVVLGALVFYSRSAAGFNLQLWTGLLLAILGTAIIVFAYFVQKPSPELVADNV